MNLSELDFDPERPPMPLAVDWAAVEAWLGLPLPGDYKALASAYGPVVVGGSIEVQVPCRRPDRASYEEWIRDTKSHCRTVSRERPPYRPPAFRPTPGGLLPWGSTGGSVDLFWDTSVSTDPDRWTVVLFQYPHGVEDVSPWLAVDLTLSGFLETVLLDRVPLPNGGFLGPLPLTACAAWGGDPRPWRPPQSRQLTATERLFALDTGQGLAALRQLVPPPTVPYLGEGSSWERLFAKLGTRLPRDYVELMQLYGSGCWGDWLCFFTPLRPGRQGMSGHVMAEVEVYRDKQERWPESYPLPVRPEPGGFLPFAVSIDCDFLGWLTSGDPDGWPVVVAPRHSPQGPPLDGTLTDVLLAWSRGRLGAVGLPGLDPEDDPFEFAAFESATASSHW